MTIRDLHDALLHSEEARFPSSRLAEWARDNPEWIADFAGIRAKLGPHDPAPDDDAYALYALSRVIELLNLSFQPPGPQASAWPGPQVPLADVCGFVTDLGLSASFPEEYSAFDCEVVTVSEADTPNAPPALVAVDWPCVMLGDLMICRAGARVRAGAEVMNPAIAASSTMYWAYARRNRPREDLSLGWGHNSQWRTRLRRDYRVLGRCYYNVDGRHDLAGASPSPEMAQDLTREERVELLLHRCFVRTSKRSNDRWPYDDKLVP